MKKIKLLLILFTLSLIVNCQKDIEISENPLNDNQQVSNIHENRGAIIENTNFEDVLNNLEFNLLLNRVDIKTKKFGYSNKTTSSTIFGFKVDTKDVRTATFDNYKSYTFKIFRGSESKGLFENLLI